VPNCSRVHKRVDLKEYGVVRSDEQSYQLELHAYIIIFLDFKYKPLSFVSMEIGTNKRVPIIHLWYNLLLNQLVH
jgi:hypothetical protein